MLITDLAIAEPGEMLVTSDSSTFSPIARRKPGAWRLIDYESERYSGRFLQASHPDAAPLTLPLNVSGWHALSIGIAGTGMKTTDAAIEVRLSGDSHWQRIRTREWNTLTEEPWIIGDLTGRRLEIRYPVQEQLTVARLFSVRAVPVSAQDVKILEKAEKRNVMFFNDGHGIFHSSDNPGPYLLENAIRPFAGSEWNICCFGAGGADLTNFDTKIGTVSGDGAWDAEPGWLKGPENLRTMIRTGNDPMRLAIRIAHNQGTPLLAYIRNQQWTCEPPLDQVFRSRFYTAHPEYCCIEADGTRLGSKLSIGFKPVRDQMNGVLRECLDRGADGVAICFVRGFPIVRYEGPVLDRYRELFSQDAREVPSEDERLRQVWCEFAALWMRELRELLDAAGPSAMYERRKLAVICGPNLEWNLQYGIDVASWAKERLVDIVAPYPRGIEHDGDALAPGIREYAAVLHGTDMNLLPSLGSFTDHQLSLHHIRRRAHSFYDAGATGLSRWDTDHWLTHLGWDNPKILRLWVEKYMPPSENTIISLAGLERIRFTPRIGV